MSLWADRMHQGKRTYGFPPGTLAWMDQRLSLKQRQGCQFGLPRGVFCSQQAQRRQFSRREAQTVSPPAAEEAGSQTALENQPLHQRKGGGLTKHLRDPKVPLLCPIPLHPSPLLPLSCAFPRGPTPTSSGLGLPFLAQCGAWFGPSILVSPVHSLDHFMDLLCLILMTSECYVQPLTSSTWPFPSVDGCLD